MYASLLRCTLVCASMGAPLLAQVSWTKQAPNPTNADMYGLAVVSPNELWTADGEGWVHHSQDGGETWDATKLDTDSLRAVFFIDEQHGWAAGNGFFHTADGGETWIKDSEWGSISDLYFLDAQHGWAAGNGGLTYRTTNGGVTWTWKAVGTIITLSSIWFVDAQNGWTVDIDGRIYHSTDGGQSWTLQWHAHDYLSTLQFFDPQSGWAIGGDTFLRTSNAGQTWTPVAVPPNTWSHGARFADALHGISVGESGNIVITSNGGQLWTTVQPMGGGPDLWDVESADASISSYTGEAGALASTADGGTSWASLQNGGAGTTHGMDAVDAQHAWAANDGGQVLRTEDGGQHWNGVVVPGFDTYGRIDDVDFLDMSLGWAVGRHEFFGSGTGRIVRSTDGGLHWQVQHSVQGAYFEAVEVLDALRVFAIGNVAGGPRFVLRTTNGGQSWMDVSPSQALFMDADFVGANTGWIVGGQIYGTTNGGQNWTLQHTPAQLMYSVSFADALHGWAVGWGPTILATDDGGQTWTPQPIDAPSTNVFWRVQALSRTAAWVSGYGVLARTDDGGQSWETESVPGAATAWLEALHFLDAENGWVGGSSGIWYRAAPWLDIGHALAGAGGAPSLEGDGSLQGGSELTLALAGALPFASTTLVIGLSDISLPFKGGTLVPAPNIVLVGLATNAAGTVTLGATFPTGVPPGLSFFVQAWIADPAGPAGYAASNALAGTAQ